MIENDENSSVDKYVLYDISDMANKINTASGFSVLEMYFINGEYELGGNRAPGQAVVTVNIHGLLDNNGNPNASIRCTELRNHSFIHFVFENLKMNGANTYASGFYFGLRASSVTYKHCYFKGKQAFYSEIVVCNDCIFDSTNMIDTPDYAIYSYSSIDVEFNRCIFRSDGKALKIYSEGSGANAKFKLTDCNFFNIGKLRKDKAAIEVNSEYQPEGSSYKIYITRCHQTDYNNLYHDDSTKAYFIVTDSNISI